MKTNFFANKLLAPGILAASLFAVSPAFARHMGHTEVGISIGAELPHGFISLSVGHQPYYFYHGAYYRHGPRGYYVVRAPRGALIRELPPHYARVVISGRVYYRYAGVYYVSAPGGYCVVDDPPVAVVTTAAPPVPAEDTSYQSVWLGDTEYLFKDGQFFKKSPQGMVWQEPPYGAITKTLPQGATSVWFHDDEYFECNGIYFRKTPDGYKVVEAPWNK